ncbi:hypothetical protein QMA71_26000 [Pseudomonas otitidis]|uniref:hypothetical protein n=1 Tax=Metapseudomonas otitidis TaxID=319939 RepID=UPI0024ADE947|nr:hypothetical protein [Pseudomonas otitidis]MDI6529000.1 hypothetical protein [Pseudomonas otitidis]
METELRLGRKDDDSGSMEVLTGSFSNEDIELLNLFVSNMERVLASRALQNGLPVISNIEWSKELGLLLTCESIDDSALHELLHVLRPLILQNERASFHQISALIVRRFADKELNRTVKGLRHCFERGQLAAYMDVSVGGQSLFDDELFKIWLNGEQYHSDKNKARVWREFEMSLSSSNTRALVINQLNGRVAALCDLLNLINMALGSRPSE